METTTTRNSRGDVARVALSTLSGIAVSFFGVVLSCNCFPDWTSYLPGMLIVSLGTPSAIRLVRSASRSWRTLPALGLVAVFVLGLGVHVAATGAAMRVQARLSGSYWHRSCDDGI